MRCMYFALLSFFPLSSSLYAQTVFVAGGSGQTGIEVVRELSRAGYKVVASTRNAERARTSHPDIETWVEVDAHDPVRLNQVVDGADIVVSALGHGDFVGPGAPQFVGYLAVRNLVDAAIAADAKHVILVTSATAGHARGIDHREEARFGYVLYWKTKAEDYLIESGLPYTIIGPGGLANEFLINLRAIEAPPPEGWGVKLMARPDYTTAFIDRSGVADAIKQAIDDPTARGKSVAVVWDKSVPAGQISGAFADILAENTGRSYSTLTAVP